MARTAATSPARRILIVGAAAGPARTLREVLAGDGRHAVTICTRRPIETLPGETGYVVVDYLDAPLAGSDVVVNLVGQVAGRDPGLHRHVNVDLPVKLARRARDAGVGHVIHLSTLAVYGAATDIGVATPTDPQSLYGSSKLEGDSALLALATAEFRVTIVRAPAIYGLGLKGKLASLARFMARYRLFVAPPTDGPRSTLHVRHLAFAIVEAIEHEVGGLRFAADPWPFSLGVLADVVSRRGRGRVAMIRAPAWLFAPVKALAPGAHQSLFGRSVIAPGDTLFASDRAHLDPLQALGDLIG